MAKWGEGDPRWIVEERPDATNVNNWHWVEKNATPWSKDRLRDLLIGQSIEKGSVKIDLKEFKKIEGEATANNRKAKLIFLYDWQIEIRIMTLHLETTGPHEGEIRYLANNEGLAFIRKKLGEYIRELREEFSKGIILPTDKPKAQVIVKGKTAGTVDKKTFQNQVITSENMSDATTKQNGEVKDVKMYEGTETFKVPPERLYEFLTDPELVKVWSNDSAKIDVKEGGEFSFYNGQITGKFEKLVENKELKLKWRTKKYPEGHYANVTLTLKDQHDSTDLVIKATDIPSINYEETETGFNRYYFQSIGRAFGCGMKIW